MPVRMENFDRKNHWENIYKTKELKDLSWYQPSPDTSLDFLKQLNIPKSAKIIDIGGGDCYFVDNLLDLGFQEITVLDISESALEKAKQRLGERAAKVKWIVSDATAFKPTVKYDFWHDRATFHFLTSEQEIESYINTASQNITTDGILLIGTFSEKGPEKCSGIGIKQYSEISMTEKLKKYFKKIRCLTVDHQTPFNTIQNFIFCSFRKLQSA
jgi:ubiquinone/menaquinone biosynthesis C-methylase UbiE